jgi:Flp pilus assembly protein TadG
MKMTRAFSIARNVTARFFKSTSGSTSLINMVVAVPLVAAGASAIDYARVTRVKDQLQHVVDGAALAAAAAQNFKGKNRQETMNARAEIARAFVVEGLKTVDDSSFIETPVVQVGPNTVDVQVTAGVKAALFEIVNALPNVGHSSNGQAKNWESKFTVSSKAGYLPERYLCLLAMHPNHKDAVVFEGNSEFMATCAVQANSDNSIAMRTWGSAYAYAYNFCAVGGWSGSGFQPNPVGGCKSKTDPYAGMTLPTPASCSSNFTNVQIKNSTANLLPGTYCGGLTLRNHGVANLAPGLYIIKDGRLSVDSQSKLNAPAGVVFYLTGNSSGIDIASGAEFTLVGPNNSTAIASTEPYKGFAIMQDRNTAIGATNTVYSKGGVNITGAFYTPSQKLVVWANGNMNTESPFFPMIVNSLEMNGNATLYVNLDYTVAGLDEPGALRVPANVFVSQ